MSAMSTEGDDQRGYLDAASGLPPAEAVTRGWSSAFRLGWPDPSRRYPGARAARTMVDRARSSVADRLEVDPAGVFFAPDADLALWWALSGYRDRRLIVSAVEDVPVLRAVDVLAGRGRDTVLAPVDSAGAVDPDTVAALAREPAAVVLQHTNPELGTRQPLAAVRAATGPETPLLVDARACLGREPLTGPWDVLVADPRMWGGPPGCAVVAAREPARWRPDVPGTAGAGGIEAENPPAPLIALAALALESAGTTADSERVGALNRWLRDRVSTQIPDVTVVGGGSTFISMFSVLYVAADELVDGLARLGWAVASGASCTSDTRRPHHVLVAVGASTHGSLRVSLPPWATAETVAAFAADLADLVPRLRADAGAADL